MEGSSSTTSTKCGFSKAGVEGGRLCESKLFCAELVVVIARTFFEFQKVCVNQMFEVQFVWQTPSHWRWTTSVRRRARGSIGSVAALLASAGRMTSVMRRSPLDPWRVVTAQGS